MTANADLRRGWCPSIARPMPSGDGLLVRFAIPEETASAATLRGIAGAARRFGNGLVDLTRRGKLQLRGVRETELEALGHELEALGLDDAGDGLPDVLTSPLAGIDKKAICDVWPIAAALRERIAADAKLAALPAKFCIAIEDGGRLGLGDLHADIRFAAQLRSGEIRLHVSLGGDTMTALRLGSCAPADVAPIACGLAGAYLDLADAGRMRGLIRRPRAVAALRAAAVAAGLTVEASRGARRTRPLWIGFLRLDGMRGTLGVGAPFGRLTADQLEGIADLADESRATLRPTPWRTLLFAMIDASRAAALKGRLARLGLITSARDPRLAVATCVGQPACAQATVSTREHAQVLASAAQRLTTTGVGLHLSGCRKGCAHSSPTRATLVGRQGRYDLVVDGMASDAPSLAGLTLEEASAALAALVPQAADEGHSQDSTR